MMMIKTELQGINSEDGGWNPGYLWKLRKKISPRPVDPPTAMKNSIGVLLTDPIEIQRESVKYYQQLFEDLPINPEYKNVQIWQEKLCNIRLKLCAEEKTDLWTMADLNLALKDLKNGTSRDPHDYTNELF